MRVAKTYTNWNFDETKAYEKNGKLYVDATTECPRCGGRGLIISRVENGQPIPIPVANGICFQCEGHKTIAKSIRLYTDKEYSQMERAAEKAAQKRHEAQEEKMKAEFEHKRQIWDKTNGFNEDGYTYIILGNSFSIKDQLKEAGFHFNGTLKRWMKGEPTGIPQDYKGEVVKISEDKLIERSAWGDAHFISGAKEYIDNLESELGLFGTSSWLNEEIGDRIKNLNVTLEGVKSFQNQYGVSQIVSFKTLAGDIIKWFTKVNINYPIGSEIKLTGTIKEKINDKYEHNMKVTIMTRCKLSK